MIDEKNGEQRPGESPQNTSQVTGDETLPYTHFQKGLICFILGIWFLHEATIFGVLLHNPDAWVLYPLNGVLIFISSLLDCPYIFWTALFFIYPLGGFALFFTGIMMMCRAKYGQVKPSKEKVTTV